MHFSLRKMQKNLLSPDRFITKNTHVVKHRTLNISEYFELIRQHPFAFIQISVKPEEQFLKIIKICVKWFLLNPI